MEQRRTRAGRTHKAGTTPVHAITHADKRANLPISGEDARDFVTDEIKKPASLRYPRDTTLDPQLVWRGKDEQDANDLVADAPPIFIQEKIDPRAIIENLRRSADREEDEPELRLFDSFDGLPPLDLVEFYRHQANWSNRMILGDSLNVMASLAEREGLRRKIQMIYIDPPYGIKFNSNWQLTVRSRDVHDGRVADASREVEQIRAFRDTWDLGIHSYLSYMRDRLALAKTLLTDSGSIFIQIGDENVHLVRSILDEIFSRSAFVALLAITKSGGGLESTSRIPARLDYILWYTRGDAGPKYRPLFEQRIDMGAAGFTNVMLPSGEWRAMSSAERSGQSKLPTGAKVFRTESLTKPGPGTRYEVEWNGRTYTSGNRWWGNPKDATLKLLRLGRVRPFGNTLRYIRFADDFQLNRLSNLWDGIGGASDPTYVVQTNTTIVERCLLMSTDPGDLVLDPTCGSGTTAFVAEQWGRRWITIDTSRVALALARQRIMGARFPYYLLADSPDGRRKESEVTGVALPDAPTANDIRHGFVYDRMQRLTLSSIANNPDAREGMTQDEIESALRRHADHQLLYDKPYEDGRKVRVSGPFSVESLSPHRSTTSPTLDGGPLGQDLSEAQSVFEDMIRENLAASGIQNGRRQERLIFDSVEPYASPHIQFVAQRAGSSDDVPNRVGVSLGPQYGTIGSSFIKNAAREAIRAGDIDLLCVLGFAFDPTVLGAGDGFVSSDQGFAEVTAERQMGRVPVLLVRMNADLVMGKELRTTSNANLFTVFGEPDIDVRTLDGGMQVLLKGVDVYDPNTGELRSHSTDRIALWMIDTDYDGESFFVRHCYFTGGREPYERLQRALKADIDEDAWDALYRTESLSFPRPESRRIAVKIINDYGDEVVKVIYL